MADTHVVIEGGKRPTMADAEWACELAPSAPVTATLTLRGPALPDPGPALSRDEFQRDYAASADDIATVKQTLERFGLRIEQESALSRSVIVSGTAGQIEEAFRPGLGIYRSAGQGKFRGREGEVQVPVELDGIVTGVFGLDQRRVARRSNSGGQAGDQAAGQAGGQAHCAGPKPFGPAELESHYRFPAAARVDETIAIAEFGGGLFDDDLAAFCARYGRPCPRPTVAPLGLKPLSRADISALPQAKRELAQAESREVTMDVEIVAGLCPGAHIIVYFATFDQKGLVDVLNAVISGNPAAAVVLSVSWGLAEDGPGWSKAALTAINERLQAASVMGITVCAASGDDGASDQVHDGRVHVHFPASSPYVLAVGGTMLDGEEELVWWEDPGEGTAGGRGGSSGGGVSVEFPRPPWQTVPVASLNPDSIAGRIVPDVAALAGSPNYELVIDGRLAPTGGTSAATPLWAALSARITALRRSRASPAFLAPLLYKAGCRLAFTDITRGCNRTPHVRGYKATTGYDAPSGWGVPDGQAVLRCL
jgi:kumamolisin